jgi:hypothetical protein
MKGMDIMLLDIEHSIWFDKEGTRWTFEATWVGCDVMLSDEPFDRCPNHAEYLGIKRNGIHVYICKEHFDEIKN